ncbi:nucleotide exchange factor GrpE [Spirochaeta africana]|uniref:Protein GrpE n=1 Tax=Spirochaeta africana (strain ATCC 700263 / DSM 8902 / Z-7692) TaxID=889378 RepID=H9UKG9_SPIAZ|nr:nucleotide exchange factor GrpE [Spirochaeta africana]AFG38012.1 molecular chaperone GrpE (heat shock protein) [Spirochaeta africana DSM 8902]
MSTNEDYSKETEENLDQDSVATDSQAAPDAETAQEAQAAQGEATAAGAESRDEDAGTDFLQQRVAALEEENSELKDKYLRKHADFENFRKRMLREKEDFAKYANQQILADLVNVIDDFERAISSTRESQDFQAFHDGVVMIEKQLVGMLENKYGLKRFESVGDEFDPQRHEAVASAPAEEGQDVPKVAEVFQKGYMLHDRVLRSAKVKVSTPGS